MRTVLLIVNSNSTAVAQQQKSFVGVKLKSDCLPGTRYTCIPLDLPLQQYDCCTRESGQNGQQRWGARFRGRSFGRCGQEVEGARVRRIGAAGSCGDASRSICAGIRAIHPTCEFHLQYQVPVLIVHLVPRVSAASRVEHPASCM